MPPSNSSFRQSNDLIDVPCEWLRVQDAVKRFSFSRSTIYNLIKAGSIKSKCLRKVGNSRGARRINAESVRLFIESQPE